MGEYIAEWRWEHDRAIARGALGPLSDEFKYMTGWIGSCATNCKGTGGCRSAGMPIRNGSRMFTLSGE